MSGDPSRHEAAVDSPGLGGLAPGVGLEHILAALGVLSEGIVVLVASGEIVACNPAAERILGLTRDQILGRTPADPRWRTVHEDGSPFPGETHPGVLSLRTGESFRGVVMGVPKPDGTIAWISCSSVPIPGPDGRPSTAVGTFVDITGRRTAEVERTESEAKYRRLYQSMTDAFVSVQMDGRIVESNRTYQRMLGYTGEELRSLTYQDLTPGRWHEPEAEIVRTQILPRGNSDVYEKEYRHKEGMVFPVELRATLIRDAEGRPQSMSAIVRDITDRRKAEEALRRSEEDFRYLFEKSVVGMSLTRPSGEVHVNGALARMLGYEKQDLEGRRWQEISHPDDVEVTQRALVPLTSGERDAVHFVKRYLHRNGSIVWAEVWTSIQRDEAGAPVYFMTSVVDITERREKDEALRQSEEKYRMIVDSTQDGIWLIDAETRTTFSNGRMAQMLGYTPEEMIGRPLSSFMTSEERAKSERNVERRRQGISEEHDFRFLKKDGSEVWTMLSTHPLVSPDGRYVGAFATVTDITGRKAAEETLQRQATMLAVAQAGARAGVWQWDMVSDRHKWAPELYRLFGLDPDEDESSAEAWGRLLHPEDKDAAIRVFELAVRQKAFLDSTYRIVRPDGVIRWIQALGDVHCGPSGEPLWMAGLCLDITEHKRIEEDLAESRRLLLDVTDNSLALMYIVDLEGRFLLANRKLSDLLGGSGRRLVGQTRLAFMSREVAESHEANDLEVIRIRRPRMFEESNTEADGLHTYLTLKYPLFDREGVVYAVGGTSIDITERKRAEEKVRRLADELELRVQERTEDLQRAMDYNRSLIEASVDPLVTIGRDGRILDVNEATIRTTGVSREELVGTDFSEYFADPDKARDGYERVFSEGTVRDYELHLRRRDAPPLPVEYNATLFRDSSGTVQGVLAAARDLSVRHQFEAELARANRELEAFSYSVSHDLRAPLRAIEGFAGLLVRDGSERLTGEDRRLLDVVRTNARHMSSLIDDLLSFSRTSRHEIRHSRMEMQAIARSAYQEVAKEDEVTAKVDFRLERLPDADGDPRLVRQVWINLLSNALKFSAREERPRIEVGGVLDGKFAVYHVRDNGVGFDARYRDKLFGVFQRLHAVKEFEGTGIGLALVKRIVERHGGRVWAESEVGKGATFSFSLPCMQDPGEAAVPPNSPRVPG